MNCRKITIDEIPFFMSNEDWYEYDFEKLKIVLTDKAPPEAIESYEEFQRLLES